LKDVAFWDRHSVINGDSMGTQIPADLL